MKVNKESNFPTRTRHSRDPIFAILGEKIIHDKLYIVGKITLRPIDRKKDEGFLTFQAKVMTDLVIFLKFATRSSRFMGYTQNNFAKGFI